ncbi:MAG: hypothetical protein ACYTGV_11690, partial [Planctomycetota bacterium]
PLLQDGLPLLFGRTLKEAVEPASCAGVIDSLKGSYDSLLRAVKGVRGAGKLAWQGWARLFADACADLFATLIFVSDAAENERAAVLARHQASAASWRARRVEETVKSEDCLPFETESFESVVGEYRK